MIVEYMGIEYVLLSDPQPTGRMGEWSAKAETIDGHPVMIYWMKSSEKKIDTEKPVHVDFVVL